MTEATNTPARRKSKWKAIYKLLMQTLEPDPDFPGFVRYKDGWSDAKIAQDVDCHEYYVRTTRGDEFGKLKNGRKGKTGGNPQYLTGPRLKVLEAQVTDLTGQIETQARVIRELSGKLAVLIDEHGRLSGRIAKIEAPKDAVPVPPPPANSDTTGRPASGKTWFRNV